MSSSYHDQFEPAWPGRSALTFSEKSDWLKDYERYCLQLKYLVSNLTCCFKAMRAEELAVKVTDEAIAHAIRESHRN